MATLKLLQTEKAYQLQSQGVYSLIFTSINDDINKIELGKLLNKEGYGVQEVNVNKLPAKKKFRGKARNVKNVRRPKRYLVKLDPKSKKKFDEEFSLTI